MKVFAFTLIELLVVMSILAILMVASLPAINAIARGSDVTRGGQALGDQIIFARQEAVNKNHDVEVRLINLTSDPNPGCRAVQIWLVGDASSSPLTKVTKLPDSVLVSSNIALSPLLTADTSVAGTTNFPGLGTCTYSGFRIRANGSLPSSVTGANNFLTVQSAGATGPVPPANYYAVRINSLTGRLSVIRP